MNIFSNKISQNVLFQGRLPICSEHESYYDEGIMRKNSTTAKLTDYKIN